MKQYLLTIIAVLAAIILALFSFDTANNQYSTRSYRTYSYNPAPNAWSGAGDGTPSLLQKDNTGSTVAPLTEANATTESFLTLPEAGSPLVAPPAILEANAMMELTPVQLPPLDAGMVNVTGGFDGNGQTAGFRVNPRPGEFSIAVPYDPSLLPQGFTEDDIQTYVYDRQYHRWIAIQRDSVNEAELLVCSRFRPWEKGLPHTQNDLANPQNALAQVQGMMSFASQGEGGGDSPLDFINAVLKTPEMPETSAYTPTSIKELKAADPLEGLTLIQPPTANNSGTANLSYPIEIPAGRQGMQPNLALTYSSSGGNGWLGVGWDIPTPSITVETRWGVPRYRTAWESEVYVYEGEQLVTKDGAGEFRKMAHRTNDTASIGRLSGNVRFYPRKDELFDSIVRHGYGPDNYWWTVTHKNGVTDYYGKKHNSNEVDYNGVLCNPKSYNIAQWMLTESVDPFGNSVKYYYDIVEDAGVSGSPVKGRQIYLSRIIYTGSQEEAGIYSVKFNRCDIRNDVVISTNRGFKEVTNSILDNVEVFCGNEKVRTYYFHTTNNRSSNYKTRLEDLILVFGQCQLESITLDIEPGDKTQRTDFSFLETDSLIPCQAVRYSFDYYNYPSADSLFTGEILIDSLPDDNIQYKCVKNTFKSTALGATKGKSWSLGATGAAGLGPDIVTTLVTLGANASYSNSKSEGLLTLIDLDGDGLADKVFKKNGKIYYRKQIRINEQKFTYGDFVEVVGAEDFLKESGNTVSIGLQASAVVSASANVPLNWATTTNYFADVNSDGLVDLVTDQGVLFNTCANGGVPAFSSVNSIATTIPGDTGGEAVYISTQSDGTANCGGIIFDGVVNPEIACTYEYSDILVPVSNLENYLDDSCYVVVGYKSNDSVKPGRRIVIPPMWNPDTAIVRNICDKEINCTPVTINPDMDAVKVWVAPYSGEIKVTSDIQLVRDNSESRNQSYYVDGVRYSIEHNTDCDFQDGILIADHPHCFGDTIGPDNYNPKHDVYDLTVKENDLLFFRLQSQNDRSFDKVSWAQQIEYTSIEGVGFDKDIYMLDNWYYDSQKEFVLTGRNDFQAPKDGTVEIQGNIDVDEVGEYAKIAICRNGQEEDSYELFPGITYHDYFQTHVQVDSLDKISVRIVREDSNAANPFWADIHFHPVLTYYADNHPGDAFAMYDTLTCYPQVQFDINHGSESDLRMHYHNLFGELYHGWGQFAYNNHDSLGVRTNCIDISRLVLPKIYTYTSPEQITSEDTMMYHSDTLVDSTDIQGSLSVALESSLYSPMSTNSRWVEMTAYGRDNAYRGMGLNTAVSSVGLDNTPPIVLIPVEDSISGTVDYSGTGVELEQIQIYDHPVPVSVQGEKVQNIRKRHWTLSHDHSFSVDMILASVGFSVSEGGNYIQSDYMDMNGDGYPDPVATGGVQYTMPWGGIGTLKPLTLFSSDHLSASEVYSYGNTFGRCYPTPNRLPGNNSKVDKMTASAGGTSSNSHVHSDDFNDYMLMDVNGDGLPDLVDSRSFKTVRLNSGYDFLDGEVWNIGFIRDGNSTTDGSSLGGDFAISQNAIDAASGKSYSVAQVSISGGTSQNQTCNRTERQVMDINGDGLPDKVELQGNGVVVSYNLGGGRWSPPEYVSNVQISRGMSYNEDVNIGVTGGFTVCALVKVNVGVQTSPKNHSFNTDCAQLVDVNGDGYPDYVTSDRESRMNIRYNRAGKTNLLKKVVNFTGSTIDMDYTFSEPCYEQPHRSWNLASVETRNNVLSCPVGGNRTRTTFEYGKPHYDRYERIGFGYDTVITVEHNTGDSDIAYRKTVIGYNNTNFFKRGRKTTETVLDGQDRPFVETIYDAMLFDLDSVSVSDSTCEVAGIYVGHEAEITNYYSYENNDTNMLTTAVGKKYDSRRNIIQYIYEGIRNSGYGEWFRAEIRYAQGMPHNMFSQPESIEVYSHDSTLLQRREAEYSDSTGRLEQLRLYRSLSEVSVYDFTYDPFGNMQTATMPQNDSGQRVMMEYQFDNTTHTYPIQVRNVAFGYTSTADYDLRFGKPNLTTDINGNEMWYEYDTVGRTIRITAPYEQGNDEPYTIKMAYFPRNFKRVRILDIAGNPYSYAFTDHYDTEHPDNDIRTTLITDGLGRLLQTKKDAELDGTEKSLVTGRIVYDCFGRTLKQYQPFSEPLGSESIYNDSLTVGTETVMEYDILDRQLSTTTPYHYTTLMNYAVGTIETGVGKCFVTTTTDALGNTMTVKSGSLGQQLRQIMPGGVETKFEYDTLGRLTKSIDPNGLETTYDYDMFGQMVHRHHPDAGDDRYQYDAAGNMVSHINGNNKTIQYRYHYNLLTDVEYPDYPANNVHYVYGTSVDTAINAVGKIILQEDGSGWQSFKYGKLGELTEQKRTFVLPFEREPYTFTTSFSYDSWNRMQTITYPDGEVVRYDYNLGGMLEKVYGQYKRSNMEPQIPIPHDSLIVRPMQMNTLGLNVSPGDIGPFPLYTIYTYPYIDSIAYNEFELKRAVFYGNGTRSAYTYDSLQRLETLKSYNSQDSLMQNITYTYDSVSNITGISNAAGAINGLGGTYTNTYQYDNLYRLVQANGNWRGIRTLDYDLTMRYDKNGRILFKNTDYSTFIGDTTSTISYARRYRYQGSNKVATIFDEDAGDVIDFRWDDAGNMQAVIDLDNEDYRVHYWTEDNRMLQVQDKDYLSYYQYDAAGERTYKLTAAELQQRINGPNRIYYTRNGATLYASPYLVITPQGYTKHYYAETERVASQMGRGKFSDVNTSIADSTATAAKKQAVLAPIRNRQQITSSNVQFFAYLSSLTNRLNDTSECYFYHPDHLGSSSWITDSAGTAVQHLHYLPFGETFVSQRSADFDAIFTFSAKEKDTETGYSYFGSRYYSSDLSIWLSVDPQASKYPSLSPYTYCANNPVMLVDPNGEEISEHIDKYGNIIAHYDDGDNSVYLHKSGTTEADISAQRRVLNNTGGEGKKVGELGGNIDQSGFFDNKLQLSAQYARKISKMGIVNRYISFYEKVKTNGDWDLKNNNSNNHQSPMRTIWGIAWKYDQDNGTNTTFSCDYFSGASAADVGNFHAGYTGKVAGFSNYILWKGAGAAETYKAFSNGHIIEGLWRLNCLTGVLNLKSGDRWRDFKFNTKGMWAAKNQ